MAEATTLTPDAPTETPTAPAPEPSWRDGLPEDLRAEKSLEVFRGKDYGEVAPALAKAFVETKRKLGERATTEPLPESWEKYEGVDPEGVQFEQQARAGFLQEMHKAGAPPSVVRAAMAYYAKYAKDLMVKHEADEARAHRDKDQAARRALEEEWGPATGADYQRNVKIARIPLQQAARAKVFRDEMEAQRVEQLGLEPGVVRYFHWIGEQMIEGGQVAGDDIMGPMDASEIEGEIERVRDQLVKLDSGSPGYEALLTKLEKLYGQAGTLARRQAASTA